MMREWRKQLARAGVTLTPEGEAVYVREDTLFLEAINVFGNSDDANMWCLRPTSELPPFEQPSKVAEESPEGLQHAMALLALVAPTVTPRPPQYPTIERRRKAKRKG